MPGRGMRSGAALHDRRGDVAASVDRDRVAQCRAPTQLYTCLSECWGVAAEIYSLPSQRASALTISSSSAAGSALELPRGTPALESAVRGCAALAPASLSSSDISAPSARRRPYSTPARK